MSGQRNHGKAERGSHAGECVPTAASTPSATATVAANSATFLSIGASVADMEATVIQVKTIVDEAQ